MTAFLNARGMTLIEVMVATVTSTVVMAGMMVVFNAGRNAYDLTEAKVTIREEIRKAFEVMTSDLKFANIRSVCTDDAANGCPGALASQLTFSPNPNYDPGTGQMNWGVDVAYKWTRTAAGSPLYRCAPATAVPPACRVIANRVVAASFIPLHANETRYGASSLEQVSFYNAGPPLTPAFSNDMPAMVDVTLSIAAARTTMSAAIPAFAPNTMRMLLRNPQQ